MAFAIQWIGPLGPATTQRDDPVDALESAMEVVAKGYTDIVIVDLAEDGKAYEPADCVKFFHRYEKLTPQFGPRSRPAIGLDCFLDKQGDIAGGQFSPFSQIVE